jgi:tetrahydrodipicolinate N-succinyltransferase
MGGQHHLERFSTYPFNGIFNKGEDAFSKGPIIIEDDVWIGYGSIILSGVTLAKGTVVAAGSVVVKSSQPYAIIGGNPAHFIKYRFDEETINILMKIDFEKLSSEFVLDNLKLIHETLDQEKAARIYSIYQDYLKDL